ncbi:carnosic acid synthase-like [Mangifera indica]|uniref:carnosic acid synthase-like n=1 Tax=Mangifera indica TaxID=29780 RepID=UPI001CFB56F2|nr:carnosic acid synthase-like [Mangifera indica]
MVLTSTFLQSLPSDNITLLLFTFSSLISLFFLKWTFTKSTNPIPPCPPGPRGIPFLGNLLSLDPELHTYFAHLAHSYGPIFQLRLGNKIGVILTSPSSARQVLKDHDIAFANRDVPVTVRVATQGGRDIAWNQYGPEWRVLRKICVLKMLSNKTLDSVYDLRRREIRQTVGYLYSRVGSPVNVGEQMFLTILNVITNMLWGGSVQGAERASLGGLFRNLISELTDLLSRPNISDFYPGLARFDLQGLEKKMHRVAGKLDSMIDEIIDQRLRSNGESGEKDNEDFLQFLLEQRDGGDSKTPFTMTHVKTLLMDMVVGGSDTSSNLMEFAMAELINKPEVMEKARQELDQVVGKNNIVEESHIHKLPYLYAIMKETLRLHPVLPLLVPHCPSETCAIDGYTIQKGSRVFINVWAIHRDPLIWENPLEFIPERFLNEKWDYSGSDFNYFPFGSGRRICAGIAMAERMFMYSLATLLHSFDWKVGEGQKVDLTEKFGIVLKLKTSLVAIPTPRLPDSALYM